MVAFADVPRAMALKSELQNINAGIANLTHGGKIAMMVIAPPATSPEGEDSMMSPATIPTGDMEYPQQMVDGIVQQLRTRRAALVQDLGQLNVTDIETQPVAAAAAPAARGRRGGNGQ